MTDRYQRTFDRLRDRDEGAFIPFLVLGDPTPAVSRRLLEAAIGNGADGLELGLPFSDPVADGPVIQAAATRALAAGTTVATGLGLIEEARRLAPDLPIGLLVYANLVARRGLARFYREAAIAGADSVLVADVPVAEVEPFAAAAAAAGIAPVLIAPPNATPARLAAIAARSRGYTYVTSRAGVTGEDRRDHRDLAARLEALRTAGAAPPVVGFGISSPGQVRRALAAGAAGVIAGSAVVRRVAERPDDPDGMVAVVGRFVASMKEATADVTSGSSG